jgi:hypothetical protein
MPGRIPEPVCGKVKPVHTRAKTKTNIKTTRGRFLMKREKKKQDDRLLKRLSRAERKQQELLRHYILNDPFFKVV